MNSQADKNTIKKKGKLVMLGKLNTELIEIEFIKLK